MTCSQVVMPQLISGSLRWGNTVDIDISAWTSPSYPVSGGVADLGECAESESVSAAAARVLELEAVAESDRL